MLRTGSYRDRSGRPVHVTATDSGYVIRHADGRVEVIGR